MSYNTFLRGVRVRSGLSQEEIAELLDISQARISRYENGEEAPTLSVALGLQVIFDAAPRRVFPKFYEQVEEAVMRRAASFERRLAGLTDFQSVKKRHHLEAMAARATSGTEG